VAEQLLELEHAAAAAQEVHREPVPARMGADALVDARLALLGYEGCVLSGTQVILPPLCTVSDGAFLMGSDPICDTQAGMDEQPQHKVTPPEFAIARYPVTVAEYACFVRAGHAEPELQYNPMSWHQQREQPDHPVVNVSWHDAVAYAAWLATLTGRSWRLPNEAEWERAARWDPETRTARIYPWGDRFDTFRANTYDGGTGTTTPVGSYTRGASLCGAQDMAGNVWEWTSSLFTSYPYGVGDGREALDAVGNRVLRGGSWDDLSRFARAAYRLPSVCVNATHSIGMRVLLAATGPSRRGR
jgi:formylglycine-generating enzyme required for sulfatase activity